MEYIGALVGLGNPGPPYEGTRHNVGFALADALLADAQRLGRVESCGGGKFQCALWRATLGTLPGWWLVAKPQTYMNDSGLCVQPLLAWHKIPPAALVVLHDELDIAPGALRFKFGGGNAGHNGLRSITQHVGTPDFYRLRLGIGRPLGHGAGRGDVTPWVLGRPASDDRRAIEESLPLALRTLEIFAKEGLKPAVAFAAKCGLPSP